MATLPWGSLLLAIQRISRRYELGEKGILGVHGMLRVVQYAVLDATHESAGFAVGYRHRGFITPLR